jgi:hypothetical protein
MVSENRFDRWWVGIVSAFISGSCCYYIVNFLFSSLGQGSLMRSDLRPVLVSSVFLLIVARWLLVSRKWEKAGKGVLLVLIPSVLFMIYRSFNPSHG